MSLKDINSIEPQSIDDVIIAGVFYPLGIYSEIQYFHGSMRLLLFLFGKFDDNE